MKILNSKWFWIACFILAILFSFHQCSKAKHADSLLNENVNAYRDTVKNIKNDLGTITATKLTYQLTNAELQKELNQWKKTGTQAQKELAILSNKFKSISAIGSIDANIRIDTIAFTYPVPIPCDFKPFSVKDSVEHWKAELFVKKDKAFLVDLYVPTTEHIIFGYKDNGLFKKPEAVMDVTFGNPNITVTKAEGTITTIEEPFYKKWYLWLAAGLLGGVLLH